MTLSDQTPGAQQLLVADHAELDVMLKALITALEAKDVKKAFEQLDLFWARLAMHIRAENLHLFPTILTALEGIPGQSTEESPSLAEAAEAIEQLGSDHNFFMQELADLIKVMRRMQSETPGAETANECAAVRERIVLIQKRLETHNELEEKLVYRWPELLLEESGQSDLAKHVLKEIKNLPPRLSAPLKKTFPQ